MASISLYPPTVDSYAAAFLTGGTCRLFFSLSKYSSSGELPVCMHISVVKQSSGQSVIKKVDGTDRYRSTGILILNTTPLEVQGADDLYYVDIFNDDIQAGETPGWQSGWIYKIQIRLSSKKYDGSVGQAQWLIQEANNFSEWSTYCVTKAISKPTIVIPILKNFNSNSVTGVNAEKEYSLSLSSLDFEGTYSNDDISETLYSYRLELLDTENNVIEDSDMLYTNQYYTPNQFHYFFKHSFVNGKSYRIRLSYTTINKYSESYVFNILISQSVIETTDIEAITLETSSNHAYPPEFIAKFKQETSYAKEQEEGCIGIKLYSPKVDPANTNVCIRRADSKDNFSTWTDIKIIPCTETVINSLPVYYDYTIESNVFYLYAVQEINTNGERGIMKPQTDYTIREFEFAYLLGEGGRQLKLKFDNTMNTYTYNYIESKLDTIGGQYPFITRNGNTKYRTIPINGLISFNMDDNNTFTNNEELYEYDNVVEQYQKRRKALKAPMYDYKLEHDFREKALAFLQDGKPKLFKSTTEGNLIVRLMQVNAQPNQQLNRMIYSFTSTAHEIDDATMENYLKYGFYEVGTWSSSFEKYETKLGQVDLDFNIGDNIIAKIWELYDHSDQDVAGSRIVLKKIHHVRLEFCDTPLLVDFGDGGHVLGNQFKYKTEKASYNTITVNSQFSRVYVFDENISFGRTGEIEVLPGCKNVYDGKTTGNKVHILVDFLYETGRSPYVEKEIDTHTTDKGVGQIYGSYAPGTNLYNEIYYKFYKEWEFEFRRLSSVTWTCIETTPGAVFQIQDGKDSQTAQPSDMYHDINWTGVLNLEGLGTIKDLRYVGMRQPDGSIDTNAHADIIVDYFYYITEGSYKRRD